MLTDKYTLIFMHDVLDDDYVPRRKRPPVCKSMYVLNEYNNHTEIEVLSMLSEALREELIRKGYKATNKGKLGEAVGALMKAWNERPKGGVQHEKKGVIVCNHIDTNCNHCRMPADEGERRNGYTLRDADDQLKGKGWRKGVEEGKEEHKAPPGPGGTPVGGSSIQ